MPVLPGGSGVCPLFIGARGRETPSGLPVPAGIETAQQGSQAQIRTLIFALGQYCRGQDLNLRPSGGERDERRASSYLQALADKQVSPTTSSADRVLEPHPA